MAETEHHERRQHKRAPFTKEVEIVGAGLFRCSNLSAGGMFLETVQFFPVGTVLDLRFKLSEADEHPINVHARVAYIYEGSGIGLYFVSLKSEDRQEIEKFIEQA
jgi:hypothetical protein